MKTSTRLAAIVALAGPAAAAHLHLPFASRSTTHSPDVVTAAQLQRRSSSSLSAKITHIESSYSSYLVNVTVGTPPQDVALLLSANDAVTWVPDATYCADDGDTSGTRYSRRYLSCDYGAFNVNLSSSWARDLDGDGYDQTFDAGGYSSRSSSYTAGNSASGKSLRETLGFAGAAVPNVTLGLASSAAQFVGALGLGFNGTDSSYDQRPAFLDSLLAAGLVETKAYSVWLDDGAGAAGNLLLGAVDRSAFTPPLVRYDMGGSVGGSSGYRYSDDISVDIASVNTSATADGPLEPFQNKTRLPLVSIDPFEPLSYLPGPLAKKMWDLAGATWDEDSTWATVPCSARDDVKARVAVQFGDRNGPVINLPVSDLILPAGPWYASRYSRYSSSDTDSSSDTTCVFGIQSPDYDPDQDETNFYSAASSASSSTAYVAGAALLKHAYIVLDLANKELALAPVKRAAASATPADVVPFASYGALMPESTSYRCLSGKSYMSDNCTGEYSGSGSRSGRSGSSGDGDDNFGGLGKSQMIGLIVGLSIVGLTMLAVAIWGIIQCTRDNRKYSPEAMKEAQIGGAESASTNAPPGSSAPAPAAAQSQPARAAPP